MAKRPSASRRVEPAEAAESVPSRVQEMLAMFQQVGPPPSPLADKITSEHITAMLDLEQQRLGHVRSDRTEERKSGTTRVIVACTFVLILIGLLTVTGNSELLKDVLIGLVGLVAGAFGGYGYGRSQAT